MKVVYCLTDSREFRLPIRNSIRTLTRFVDKEDIIFIMNPYVDGKFSRYLSKFGLVHKGDEFYYRLDLPKYKFKIELCDIDDNEIIFLDCDTLVMKDITELLDGNYDFFGREMSIRDSDGKYLPKWNQRNWNYCLEKFGIKKSATVYNDGFIIFKNNLHKKIKDDWIKYYKMFHAKEIPSPNNVDDMHHNIYALGLAIGNYRCAEMNERHHWYGWQGRPFMPSIDDTYVIHVGTLKNGIKGYKTSLSLILSGGYTI